MDGSSQPASQLELIDIVLSRESNMSAIKTSKKDEVAAADTDEAALSSETETVSVTPEEGADPESDSSKLKLLLGVLKKVVGVKVHIHCSSQGDCGRISCSSLDARAELIVRDVSGSQDLANLRLSLPANLLAPEGNLEYWHYLDRPDRKRDHPQQPSAVYRVYRFQTQYSQR